jgi:hypothetical protein
MKYKNDHGSQQRQAWTTAPKDAREEQDLRLGGMKASTDLTGTISVALLSFIVLLVTAIASVAQTPTAYVGLGNDLFGTVDLTTGAYTQTANLGVLFSGIGVGPGGSIYGSKFQGSTLYQVNPATGALTTIGNSSVSYYDFGSTTSGVYGLDRNLNLYIVDPTTAATTLIGPTGLHLPSGFWIGASTGSNTLYFTMASRNSPEILYSINTNTGVATEIGNTGVPNLGAMVFENGTLFAGSGASGTFSIYTLDLSTGLATLVTTTNSGAFWGLAPSVFPSVLLSPTSLKLGSVQIGKTSAPKNVVLTNSGSVALTINSLAASGNFSETDNCAGQTLQPNATCKVSVAFTPSVTGSIPGALTIVDNAINTPQILSLSGTGLAAVSLSPPSLSFGTVTVATTSQAQTVTLTNNATGPVVYTFLASSNYAAVGSGTHPCNGTLAAKARCTISVTFTPTANGSANGALAISSSSFPTQIENLSGVGSGGGTSPLTFSPDTTKFSNVVVGHASPRQMVKVTNSSTSTVNITNFAASADYSAVGSGTAPCGGNLAPGKSCIVAVTFKPSIPGTLDGSVAFMDNAKVNTQLHDLSGTAVLPVSFSPTSLMFPAQKVGKTSATKTITLTNNQSTTLRVSSILASGQYSAVPGGTSPCGSTVAPRGKCTFVATFTPAQTGTIPGVVSVSHRALGSPQNIKLSGKGQ